MKTSGKGMILLIACLAMVNAVNAQGFRVGLKVGYNASTLSGYEELGRRIGGLSDKYTVSYKSGFHVGLAGQYSLNSFFIQPELLYSSMGLQEELGEKKESSSLNYLQLPIYAGYKFHLAQAGPKLILGAGPYMAYGLSATDDVFDITSHNSQHGEDPGVADNMFNRFDAGLSFMGGLEFSSMQITIGYDLGLVDMVGLNGWKTAKDLLGLPSVCNRNLKISAVCFF